MLESGVSNYRVDVGNRTGSTTEQESLREMQVEFGAHTLAAGETPRA